MRSLTDTYTLAGGVNIPCVGFGTWQAEGAAAVGAVTAALQAGYRHIDTAAEYGNEAEVGEALKGSAVPRSELFITTKLMNDDHGYDAALRAFHLSLQKLGLDYVDLYLIHWPNPIKFRGDWQRVNAETWRAFEELYRSGKARAIGVSNFLPHHLEELMKTASTAPMVNQIRLCPGDWQEETVAYCRRRAILPEAYSPLGTGGVFPVPSLREMAGRYGRSAAQLCLRWSLQMGFLPLPKSVTPARIAENARLFDFEIADADMAAIRSLKGVAGYADDPDTVDW